MNTISHDVDSESFCRGQSEALCLPHSHYHVACRQDGPLAICTEFVCISSICSRYLQCPTDMLPNWECATTSGTSSNLSSLQAMQVTLSLPYCDASVISVQKTICADLRPYDCYCVFAGVERRGPYRFGEGFPIPPVTCPSHWIIVPCSPNEETMVGLSFCESFVCALSLGVRTTVPHTFLCDTDATFHRLCICKSIPWQCMASELTWDQVIHREGAARCSSDILTRPAWQCSTDNSLLRMTYSGSLVSLALKTGVCDICIHDGVCIEIPLTSSFATLPYLKYAGGGPSGANQTLMDEFLQQHVAGSSEVHASPFLECVVSWEDPVNVRSWIKSLPTTCRVCVRGMGALDGTRLLATWGSDIQPLNDLIQSKVTLGQLLRRVEYEILSGLLEIDAHQDSTYCPAIVVEGLSIISPPKRYKSSVQLNGYNVYDVSNSDNRPVPSGSVEVCDLKLLGGWSAASNGPETLATGSSFRMCLYHLASDAIRLGASCLRYSCTTLLQGNAGGCVNVGCDGRLPMPISDICTRDIFVHRVCQIDGQSDGLGALITSRNSGTGGSVSHCRISNLHVPFLGGSLTSQSVTESNEASLRGPNVFWRVSAIGYLVSALDATAGMQTAMSDIDLISISPRFLPLVQAASWFLYYRMLFSPDGVINAATSSQLQMATLGHMRLTLPASETPSQTRCTYEETACKVYSFPQDPLRLDYYVCANASTQTYGIDSYWLEKQTGYDVPTNVETINITPSSITTPLRPLIKSTSALTRLQRLL